MIGALAVLVFALAGLGGRSASAAPACAPMTETAASRLTLADAVTLVLCSSPQLGQAIQLVDEKAAGVDLARSAFNPRFSAAAELSANRIPSSDSAAGSLRSSATGSLGMSWVFYDSGVRRANLAQSNWQLASARSAHENAVLTALNEVLRLYVEAADASTRLEALRDAEESARQILLAADARHAAFVGSLNEKLQAQTAVARARVERVKGEGTWLVARGLLALAMGLAPELALKLAPVDEAFRSAPQEPLGQPPQPLPLTDHPRVRGAQAEILALRSRLESVRAESGPSVSLGVGSSATRDLRATDRGFDHRLSGSVYASIPLFNQQEARAREGEILAQIAGREAVLAQVEREVRADAWRAEQVLDAESRNLAEAKILLDTALQGWQIALGRYRAGVGPMLELLASQDALSAARVQLTQSQLAVAQARLKLLAAAGKAWFMTSPPG